MTKIEGSGSRIRIRIQDPDPNPDPNPDPDPLVRGMDPRIRIHPKMAWIRNTGYNTKNFGFVTIRVPFLKKCLVFDLTLAQSNIEHPLIFVLFD
jgi:hypothetical protein